MLLLLAAQVLGPSSGIAAVPVKKAEASAHARFDHPGHAKALAGKGKPEVACNDCHKLEASSGWEQRLPVGKAGGVHTPCSNAGCHQDVYAKFQKTRDTSFCFTCHVGKLGKELAFPPYRERGPSDFYLASFGHKDHIREGNKGCPQCHTALAKPVAGSAKEMKRVSHDRCGNAICHGESIKPKITECSGCHAAKDTVKPTTLASSSGDQYSVARTFSHPAHAKKSPKDECGTCHTNAAVARGAQVPLPPMIACETCHNGQTAFTALGTTCTRCHAATEEKK